MFAHVFNAAHTIGSHLPMPQSVTTPTANAPAELKNAVNTVLGLIKWISLAAVMALLLSAGGVALAGDMGRGSGLSSEMRNLVGRAILALIVIGSAASIINFVKS